MFLKIVIFVIGFLPWLVIYYFSLGIFNSIFTIFMNLIFFGGFYLYFTSDRAKAVVPHHMPTILATLGIFGTFLGIFLGLLNFNVGALQESIPDLLSGLKIAFFTSILGMFFGLFTRLITTIPSLMDESEYGEPLDPAVALLGEIRGSITNLTENVVERLESISHSLVGEGDTTLITQLQKLRLSLLDKQDELVREFKSFAQTMAESNTDALIEALNDVIRDFNLKISEQFGENFKHLNEALGRLLEWQEAYRSQMQGMIEQIRKVSDSVSNVEEALSKISDDSKTVLDVSQQLQPILETVRNEIKVFESNLDAFAKLSQEAHEALPSIEATINSLVGEFSQKVQTSLEESEQTLRKQSQHTDRLLENHDKLIQQIEADLKRLSEENRRAIENYIGLIEPELEKALKRSLESLGNSLVTLSRKFADDYTPLTEKLREIVRLAEGASYDKQKQDIRR